MEECEDKLRSGHCRKNGPKSLRWRETGPVSGPKRGRQAGFEPVSSGAVSGHTTSGVALAEGGVWEIPGCVFHLDFHFLSL